MQARSRPVALLAVLALPLGGCSALFMAKAPDPVAEPNRPVRCTSSKALPIVDTVCAGVGAANALAFLIIPSCSSAAWGEPCLDSGVKYAGAAISAGAAIVCAISAGSGYPQATRCHQVRDLNARCMSGDLGACQQLRPGWTPTTVPPGQQPPSPGAPTQPPPSATPPQTSRPDTAEPAIDLSAYQAAVAAAAR